MGFNRRKLEDDRRRAAEKEAATRRAADPQILEDAERLIAAWNERQAKRMPMRFSPTIGAAITARSQFGARRVIPLVHRRFRVSNSIQIQNSRRPKLTMSRALSPTPRHP